MKYNFVQLPDDYRNSSLDDLARRIQARKHELGDRVVVLTHHYQRYEVVCQGDYIGDSYGLCKIASQLAQAEYIVFCGVHFMAEAANILGRPEQKTYLPNLTAGCPMADMAKSEQVYDAWDQIENAIGKGRVVPISYMNSSAELKAFTGKNGGLICTSSNADAAFKWALSRYEKFFFFPDQHLGRNTAKKYGIPRDQVVMYDPRKLLGGIDLAELEKAKVILWYGYCHVHAKFHEDQIDQWRLKDPSVKIVVHPECEEAVVDKADAAGSTSFIVDYVEKAPTGSTIAIGTELNLVHRLAIQHPDKKIYELSGDSCALCSNMFRTTLADLCYVLDNFSDANLIVVPDEIKADAKIALQRMLEVGT